VRRRHSPETGGARDRYRRIITLGRDDVIPKIAYPTHVTDDDFDQLNTGPALDQIVLAD
jgi:hypothetical protein